MHNPLLCNSPIIDNNYMPVLLFWDLPSCFLCDDIANAGFGCKDEGC